MAASLSPPASASALLKFSFPLHSFNSFSSTSRSTFFFVAKAQSGNELDTSSDEEPSSSKKPPEKGGAGFGGGRNALESKEKRRGKGKRSVIRRLPIERPSALSAVGDAGKEKKMKGGYEDQGAIQNAFVLTWLGLGCIILVEGIVLAASGFLPEEWDRLLVKYLYPTFTPTVLLFIGGSVVYGVAKYLQGQKNEG